MKYFKISLIILINLLFSACSSSVQTKSSESTSPPMGWNSWNWFGKKDINEQNVREIIDAIVESGLADAGYKYVVIDGGWRDTKLGPDGELVPHPEKFPNGIKPLADYAHSFGLKLGLHTVPGTHDCGGDMVGAWGKEEVHIQQFIEWEIDYIKLDKCLHKEGGWNEDILKQTYFKWDSLLKSHNSEILFSICAYKYREWYPEIGDIARTGPDISCLRYRGANFDTTRQGVMPIADLNNKAADKAGNGYWNDPDILVVGEQGLTIEEQKVHFALWCIMTSPLMLGNDPRNMLEYEREILLNKECIAVNQDITEQGTKILTENGIELWRKDLAGGKVAILIINRSSENISSYLLEWEKAGLSKKYQVRDLLEKKSIGRHNNSLKLEIGLHSCKFLLFY
ncbi:MAG: glycoside hydrolase family 27 protein [Bacteroidales bacterium]|nr:glycoside hydrolase family 27 protein [Bacteroidales bacterium]